MESQIDPSMAEWFDIGAKSKAAQTQESDSGSETEPEPDEEEPDSENDDVRPEPEVGFDEDDDDWEQIEKDADAIPTQSQKTTGMVGHNYTVVRAQNVISLHRVRKKRLSAWERTKTRCITTRRRFSGICKSTSPGLIQYALIFPQLLLPRLSKQRQRTRTPGESQERG